MNSSEVIQDDMAALMTILGISVHARSASPHDVMVNEILPAIIKLQARLLRAELKNARRTSYQQLMTPVE